MHGPETNTKKGINFKFHWQKSLSVPSRLIKLACDLESLLSAGTLSGEGGEGKGRGVWGVFAYLYSIKNVSTFTAFVTHSKVIALRIY